MARKQYQKSNWRYLKGLLASALAMAAAASTPPALAEDEAHQLQQATEMLRPAYTTEAAIPRHTLEDRMAHYGVPGVAIAVIRDGKVVATKGFGVLQKGGSAPVDADTLFSAGSVSKVATAALVMRLQANDTLDVDAPVESYLKSWQMPQDMRASMTKPVTLRMILSHTAGFSIHGFADFLPGEDLPSVYDTLNGSGPARDDALRLLFEPGTAYKYSGGGYTLAQLVVADTGGRSFPDIAQAQLFRPLGMARSSFTNPLPETTANVAKAHDHEGTPAALPRGYEAMPEMAASGLWTSANDLGQLVATLIGSYQTEGGFIPQPLASDMMTKVAPSLHGMGPRLLGTASDRIFHHGGANNSYKAWIEGHLATGDGLVVLTNGARGDGLYLEIRNAVSDAFGWQINRPVMVPDVAISTAQLESYVGTYAPSDTYPLVHRETLVGRSFEKPFDVSMKDGQLQVTISGTSFTSKLVATAPNRFLIDGYQERLGLTELVFHRDAFGNSGSMTLEAPGHRSFYRRLAGQ